MNDIRILRATPGDLEAIQSLLLKCDLPTADVGEHIDNFLVAKQNGKIIGTVGLEVEKKAGLLRSLAVEESFRNKGVGKSLYQELITNARRDGLAEISLLTTTAEDYFSRLGFQKVASEEIPAYVKNTKEYKLFCPSNAVCMLKRIDASV